MRNPPVLCSEGHEKAGSEGGNKGKGRGRNWESAPPVSCPWETRRTQVKTVRQIRWTGLLPYNLAFKRRNGASLSIVPCSLVSASSSRQGTSLSPGAAWVACMLVPVPAVPAGVRLQRARRACAASTWSIPSHSVLSVLRLCPVILNGFFSQLRY